MTKQLRTALLAFSFLLNLNTAAEAHPIRAQISSFKEKCKENIAEFKRIITNIRDFVDHILFPSSLNNPDVSPEVAKEVRAILTEMGLHDVNSIKIKHWCYYEPRGIVANAAAFHLPGAHRYIILSEEWFKSLSSEEKRFIIGHEGMHLKLNHCTKLIALELGIVAGLVKIHSTCLSHIEKIMKKHGLDSFWIYAPLHLSTECGILMYYFTKTRPPLISSIHHSFELEADRKAVKALHCHEGAVAFFNNHPKENSSTHPSTDARIQAIKNLKVA